MNKYHHFQCRVCLAWDREDREIYTISEPSHAYALVKDELVSSDRERFLSILLTTSNTVIGIETISIGSISTCPISPGQLFKSALLANARSVILCHNHPSGSLESSKEDMEITERIVTAGSILDIEVVDHIIIAENGFISLREMNRLHAPGTSLLASRRYRKHTYKGG